MVKLAASALSLPHGRRDLGRRDHPRHDEAKDTGKRNPEKICDSQITDEEISDQRKRSISGGFGPGRTHRGRKSTRVDSAAGVGIDDVASPS
jgi:hypothetical protein